MLTPCSQQNGLTIPATFPDALYRKLLGLPVRLEHLEDAWFAVFKGLEGLLRYEGDVEDDYTLFYAISVKPPGSTTMEEINMELDYMEAPNGQLYPRPGQPVTEPSSITKQNRRQYVEDYILWLTHRSVSPQYKAFEKGFYTCLDCKAVTLFTPDSLKLLVEGSQEIDVDALEQTATYEGYSVEDGLIKDFWHVVRSFSPDQLRSLLEFVTASDRVPFDGLGSINFTIQKNGDDDEVSVSHTSILYLNVLIMRSVFLRAAPALGVFCCRNTRAGVGWRRDYV